MIACISHSDENCARCAPAVSKNDLKETHLRVWFFRIGPCPLRAESLQAKSWYWRCLAGTDANIQQPHPTFRHPVPLPRVLSCTTNHPKTHEKSTDWKRDLHALLTNMLITYYNAQPSPHKSVCATCQAPVSLESKIVGKLQHGPRVPFWGNGERAISARMVSEVTCWILSEAFALQCPPKHDLTWMLNSSALWTAGQKNV